MKIKDYYDTQISKTISLLAKTEKQLTKAIINLETSELETPSEESDISKLHSIKSESTLEVLNEFNKVVLNTIFTIHKVNNIKLNV